MKWIKYQIVCNSSENILLEKKVSYNEANLAIARAEAYNGEYEIIDDDKNIDLGPYAKLSDDTVFITSSNENPSSYLGGTWELFDKHLKQRYYDSSKRIIKSVGDYCDSHNVDVVTDGHRATLYLSFSFNVDVSETNFNVVTLDFSKLGFSRLLHQAYAIASGDDVNGVAFLSVNFETGLVNQFDVIPKTDGGFFPKGKKIFMQVDLITSPKYIDDAFCDKFFWKKVSDQPPVVFTLDGVSYTVAPDTTWFTFANANGLNCTSGQDNVWDKNYDKRVKDPTTDYRAVNGDDYIEAIAYTWSY